MGVDTSQSEAATADDPAGPARTPTHSAGQNESEGSPTRANPRSGSTRLAAGALEGLIEEFLTEHPGEHGPTAVAKAIRRSSGAVANALERMVTSGWATRTCDKPKRYRIADPSEGSGDGAAALAPTGPTGGAANAIEPGCEPDSGAAAAADNQAASAGARAAGDGGSRSGGPTRRRTKKR